MEFSAFLNKMFDFSKIKAGTKINPDNGFIKKYDRNNNSIWDRDELDNFQADIEPYIEDGKLEKEEAVSLYAKIMNVSTEVARRIFSTGNKNELENSFEMLQEDIDSQYEEEFKTVINMQNEIDSALETYEIAKKGPASAAANAFKELFNTKYAGSKVYRQLMNKQVLTTMLRESAGENGIRQKNICNIKWIYSDSLLAVKPV